MESVKRDKYKSRKKISSYKKGFFDQKFFSDLEIFVSLKTFFIKRKDCDAIYCEIIIYYDAKLLLAFS